MMSIKKIFEIKFQLSKELSILILSWLGIVIANYIAFVSGNALLQLLFYNVISLFLIGIALPVYWTIKKRHPLSDIGITKNRLWLSLVIGIVFTGFEAFHTIAEIQLPVFDELLPIIVLAIVAGLFEAVFFRGWMQLRFEDAFGIIPSILLASAFYSLYHIGYSGSWATTETLITLFLVGIMFAVLFRLTKNILIIWPFAIPVGAVYDLVKHETIIPFEAIYGYLFTSILIVIFFVYIKFKKQI